LGKLSLVLKVTFAKELIPILPDFTTSNVLLVPVDSNLVKNGESV